MNAVFAWLVKGEAFDRSGGQFGVELCSLFPQFDRISTGFRVGC
jgi:hypothetical protein